MNGILPLRILFRTLSHFTKYPELKVWASPVSCPFIKHIMSNWQQTVGIRTSTECSSGGDLFLRGREVCECVCVFVYLVKSSGRRKSNTEMRESERFALERNEVTRREPFIRMFFRLRRAFVLPPPLPLTHRAERELFHCSADELPMGSWSSGTKQQQRQKRCVPSWK